jgi:glutaredoxin-like protein
MTIIAEKDRPTVQSLLARELVDDVELVLFTRGRSRGLVAGGQDNQSCEETRELLEELVKLSDQLHLTRCDVDAEPAAATLHNVTAVPTVIVRRRGSATGAPDADPTARSTAAEIGANVRFLGLPGGYEFSTLLDDIVDISKGRTDLSEAALAVVRAIDTPVHIQVFVTPSCPYCPRAARLAHQMAMENSRIVADVIEANEFLDLSERYGVRSVPKTVINDRVEFLGSLSEAKVLDALQEAVRRDA